MKALCVCPSKRLIGKEEDANDHSKEPWKEAQFFSPWIIQLIFGKTGFAEKGVGGGGVGISFYTHINIS